MQTELTRWNHPENYGGFSPDGDILVLSKTRDSDALDRTNWDAAATRLCKAAEQERIDSDNIDGLPVYDWRANHWACGWVDYLMVRADSPAAVIDEAQAIADSLADYPALDEDSWSQLEWEEAQDFWASLPIRERAQWIKDYAPECSIFAARRPWIPENENGGLYDRLRGY